MNLSAIAFLVATIASVPAASDSVQGIDAKSGRWKIDISGYADLYYQYDFGRPRINGGVNGRWYDIYHNTYRLAAVQLDISHTATEQNPFGFFVSLYGGKNADILASTEPGGIDTYKDFLQAYVTYRIGGKIPTTIDFGKWVSFIGYEGLDSRGQDNYSRSFVFTGLEPSYMTGLRVTSTINSKLTTNAYLYQGFNEVKDSNKNKTVGLGVTYVFTPTFAATLAGYKGIEGSADQNPVGSYGGVGYPTPGESDTTQGNLYFTYTPTAKDKVALDADYASAKGKGHWNGIELIYRHQISANSALAFRAERAQDSDGLRFGVDSLLLHSLTGTYDFSVNKGLLLRFEVRHDFANMGFFNSSSGLKSSRTTLTFAQILKF